MQMCVAVLIVSLASLVASVPALAADMPAVKTDAKNVVPACVTPGRLMALLKARTPNLDPRFDTIAVEYARHGQDIGLRYDYAFFQMIVETGGLTFKDGNRDGLVKASQNNFAGLGATKGEHGESFKDVSTGVRAHLEHVQLYAGDAPASPVAERTRKVQQWGILNSWHKGFKGPITFSDVAMKWTPSRAYANSIEQVAERFNEDFCKKADPQPDLMAALRGTVPPKSEPQQVAEAKPEKIEKVEKVDKPEKISGTDLARKAIEDGNAQRSSLGAGAMAKQLPSIKIINAPVPADAFDEPETTPATPPPAAALPTPPAKQKVAAATPPPASKPAPEKPTVTQTSAAATAAPAASKPAAKIAAPVAPAEPGKCRVWTASYGGSRAIIIKSASDGMTNFTVLDVNEGDETREAEAYIAAYAKDGVVAGEFTNQSKALDKAFELCPEG